LAASTATSLGASAVGGASAAAGGGGGGGGCGFSALELGATPQRERRDISSLSSFSFSLHNLGGSARRDLRQIWRTEQGNTNQGSPVERKVFEKKKAKKNVT
jgi:hypothetical protein